MNKKQIVYKLAEVMDKLDSLRNKIDTIIDNDLRDIVNKLEQDYLKREKEVIESMTSVQDMIMETIALCREADREPVLIVMNPKTFTKLVDELDGFSKLFSGLLYTMYKLRHPTFFGTYQGISVIVSPKVKDFFIVDNRSWAEQKW